jgi:hypothetical protein
MRSGRELLNALGLVFGCFDFVVTPEGEHPLGMGAQKDHHVPKNHRITLFRHRYHPNWT